MSLFFDLLCAINSPNQRASFSQMRTIADALDAIAQQHGITPNDLQRSLSVIGPYLSAVLLQQMGILQRPADGIVHQLAEAETIASVHDIIPPSVYSEMSSAIAAQTALSDETAKILLPMLVPTVMHLLDLGAQNGVNNGNLLVSRFLNGGDAALGEVAYFVRRSVDVPAA